MVRRDVPCRRRWRARFLAVAAAPAPRRTRSRTCSPRSASRPSRRARTAASGGPTRCRRRRCRRRARSARGRADTADDVPLRMPDTSGNLPNLAAFGGQTLTLAADDRKGYTRIHFFGTTADGSGGGDFLLTYSDGSTQSVPVVVPRLVPVRPLGDRAAEQALDADRPGRGALRHLPRARRDRRGQDAGLGQAAAGHRRRAARGRLPDGAHARAARRRASSCRTSRAGSRAPTRTSRPSPPIASRPPSRTATRLVRRAPCR